MNNKSLFPDNVISIKEVRNSRYAENKRHSCAHKNLLVNKQLAELECADCGSLLNPVQWILSMMHEFIDMEESYQRLSDLRKQINDRTKTKCQHCNRITLIRGLK